MDDTLLKMLMYWISQAPELRGVVEDLLNEAEDHLREVLMTEETKVKDVVLRRRPIIGMKEAVEGGRKRKQSHQGLIETDETPGVAGEASLGHTSALV